MPLKVFSAFFNRAPLAGKARQICCNPSLLVNTALDKAAKESERIAVCLQSPEGHDFVWVQVAGLAARRILRYVKEGGDLAQGQRCGFNGFGSRLDWFLLEGLSVNEALAGKFSSGSSVLGHF